jgi:ribosomal-protein-alanine N-acetyltransferase
MVPGTNDPAIDATPEPATLAALDAALFVPPWNQQTYAALLGNPAVRAWVARDATDTPVAMLCVQTVADEAEVYRVGVLPAARRRGIARRLMAAAAETLRAAGIRRMFLEVRAGNGPATALYASLGFAPCGRRAGYYSAPVEDALLLEWRMAD